MVSLFPPVDEALHAECFQVMRCDDVALLQRWIAGWTDLVEFEMVAVTPGRETSAALQDLL
ncbi:MAG TPA: DUF3303 family protein [Longimicrobium sp.]